MNNIFENAYFGKPYKTRDGRKAIYIRKYFTTKTFYRCVINGSEIMHTYTQEGKADNIGDTENDEIVSEWQEPIDDKELDELAEHWCPESGSYREGDIETQIVIRNAYKAGYRKAKE